MKRAARSRDGYPLSRNEARIVTYFHDHSDALVSAEILRQLTGVGNPERIINGLNSRSVPWGFIRYGSGNYRMVHRAIPEMESECSPRPFTKNERNVIELMLDHREILVDVLLELTEITRVIPIVQSINRKWRQRGDRFQLSFSEEGLGSSVLLRLEVFT